MDTKLQRLNSMELAVWKIAQKYPDVTGENATIGLQLAELMAMIGIAKVYEEKQLNISQSFKGDAI